MFPRSFRIVVLVSLLFSVIIIGVPFGRSSAASGKGEARRFGQDSKTLNLSSRTAGPPNYDAFGASKKRAAAAVAASISAQEATGPESQAGHIIQTEPRLGVPTFLWASETGSGQGKQLSANQMQAKVDIESTARGYLGDYGSQYRLSSADVAEAKLAVIHDTGKGAIIAKFKQAVGGVEVFRDEINVIMNRELKLIALSGYLTGDNSTVNLSAQDFTLQPAEALGKALQDLTGVSLDASALRSVKSSASEMNAAGDQSQTPYLLFTADQNAAGNFAFTDEPARVKKVLYHMADGYVPAYYVETSILVPSTEMATVSGEPVMTEWAYSYVISAVDGGVLFRNDLIDDVGGTPYTYRVWADPATKVPFDTPAGNGPHPKLNPTPDAAQALFVSPNDVTLANYPFTKNDPWLASGATETVGNNVDAFVNLFNPDGYGPVAAPANPATGDFRAQITGPDAFLHTHTPDSATLTTAEARQGGVQQLFYDVNFLHDWFYDAGFNEAAGNAQTDNYGRGGIGNDSIKAQAQDMAGRNNANMLTPADGGRPRMRMYVFDNAAVKYLDVQSPAGAAGQRNVGTATFGPQSFDVTNQIVYATPTNGCTALTNAAAVAGKFVMIDMSGGTGSCSVGTKINNGMNAGAAGYILVNSSTQPNNVINVSGSLPSFTIPFLSISWNNAASIKTQLGAAQTVTARMRRDLGSDRDGALDNQIVFHEWGHYISNRLIGNANGLNTNQAGGLGEGWGDFHALLLTARADDLSVPSNANWNGAYALSTYATSGSGNDGYYYGIRRYPYSTDMTKNPLTFKHIQDGVALPNTAPLNPNAGGVNSEVHNTGEVWATMLWECYASLLRDSGRLSFQEAQERMKYYLVAAYKMTPVDPTLLEARDAILAAAFAFDRADGQLFLQAFAKRGAGIGAVAPERYSLDNSGVVESFSAGAGLSYVGAILDDTVESCDHDGYLDKNEKGLLKVTIKNTGTDALSGTTATVSSSNPDVSFPGGATINFPSAQAGQTVTASLVVAGGNLAGVQGVDFTITIHDSSLGADVTAHYLTHLNVDEIPAASATDDVEARQTAWTTGGTSTTIITGSEPIFTQSAAAKWHRVVTSASNNLWLVSDVGIGADQFLVSPVMTVDGGGSLNLQFDHSFSFEYDGGGNYDGGVIEMSVNGGAWTDAGGSAYNGTILNYGASDLNPLKGRAGFVQTSGGTVHTSVTQAIAPGSTIQIRFRVGSDAAGGATGWQVDNIAFSGVVETPFAQAVADAANCHAAGPVASQILLSPGAMPSGVKDVAYTTTLLTPSGGTAPYTYSVTPFVLPTGLSYEVVNGNLQISGTPTRLGSFPLTILVTDSLGTQASVGYTITINKPTPTLTWNNPSDITYGTALSATQLNATASVPGTFSYTPATGTVLGAGNNQSLSVNFTPTDTTTYSTASKSVSINVLKAVQTITFGPLSDKTYNDAAFALSATASSGLPVGFQIISGPATLSGNTLTITGSGIVTVRASQPGDASYTAAANVDRSFTVNKAATAITWSNPADITYGTALSATQLNATASVPGTFSYTPSAGTVLNSGSGQSLSVIFTPTDTGNYQPASKSVSVNVLKADQTITFNALANKAFGDAPLVLSASASSGLPVGFQVVSGPATLSGNTLTINGAGVITIRASQAGDSNYNAAPTVDHTFNVSSASAGITLGQMSFVYDGTAKSVTMTTNPAGLSVAVTYSQNGASVTPVNAGSYDVSATINDPNYQGTATGTLVIGKAAPVINWNDPSHITFDTPLGSAQLNATASVPGTFLYNPPAGTLLGIGGHQLSVTFTPTDAGNYEAATASVQLMVDDAPTPTFSFSSATYSASEDGGSVSVIVNRGGDLSGPAIVHYSSADSAGLTNCNVENGVASSRCDYATTVGTLRFGAGESSKTFYIPVVDDAFAEGVENFTLYLTDASGASLGATSAATITITDNDSSAGTTNPADSTDFFVRQHYIDFLGREPDPVGYPAWQTILNACASGDARCDRVEVSSGFFRSEEFQQRGYFIYRFYSLLGRTPHYGEFMTDLAKVSGFLDPQQLEANKAAFVDEFMARQEFQDQYGAQTNPTGYVNTLLQAVGQPNHPAREDWINALANGTMTRAGVLRALAESPEVGAKYYTEAFVVMQYFGYLRRDPDIHYLEWIQTMNTNGGDYRAMINGFLNSAEYRERFGQ